MNDRDRGRRLARRITVGLGTASVLGVGAVAVVAQAGSVAPAGPIQDTSRADPVNSAPASRSQDSTGITAGDGSRASDAGSGGS